MWKQKSEGQRVANTTGSSLNKPGSLGPIPKHHREFFSWVEISWVKRMDPLHQPLNSQLLLVLISWPPTGQISCWLGHIEVEWEGKWAHCLPYQCHCQAVGTSASLMGSPGSCHHPSFLECFPIMLFHWCWCPGPIPQLHRSVSSSIYLLASHLLSRESSAKHKPSLNGNLPSNVHLQPRTHRGGGQPESERSLCNKWIII